MSRFINEIQTMKTLLMGSPWATDADTQLVINELDQLLSAGGIRHSIRKSSLQIFFASRAVDTMLVWACDWEENRNGRPPLHVTKRSIGSALVYINGKAGANPPVPPIKINGNMFSGATLLGLETSVRNLRNSFLHRAGHYPTTAQLQSLLTEMLTGIRELSSWR